MRAPVISGLTINTAGARRAASAADTDDGLVQCGRGGVPTNSAVSTLSVDCHTSTTGAAVAAGGDSRARRRSTAVAAGATTAAAGTKSAGTARTTTTAGDIDGPHHQ
jgi:hypothetical protein